MRLHLCSVSRSFKDLRVRQLVTKRLKLTSCETRWSHSLIFAVKERELELDYMLLFEEFHDTIICSAVSSKVCVFDKLGIFMLNNM